MAQQHYAADRDSRHFHITTRDDLDFALRLSSRLQRSLDPAELVEEFFTAFQVRLGIDSLHCRFDHLPALHFGDSSDHISLHSLESAHRHLAELVIGRDSPLEVAEEALLTQGMELLQPALENALRYQEALQQMRRDPVTSLGNREALTESLTREVELSRRHDEPLSLLILQLEDYQELRRVFGEPTADRALHRMATLLSNRCRGTDLLYHYGDGRFVAVLSRTDAEGAQQAEARLLAALEELDVEAQGGRLALSVQSATSTLEQGDTANRLYARAAGCVKGTHGPLAMAV